MAHRNTSSEKVIEAYLAEEAKKRGWMALKFLPTFVGGLPDRILLMGDGQVSFVELKSTGEKPGKLQQVMHRKLIALGFHVWVADSIEQVDAILSSYEHLRLT